MSRTPTHIRIQMLHITNGHSVALDQTGLPGRIVYWVDVLHEGPVPAGLSLDELSQMRAEYLTEFFQKPVSFKERDEALKAFREHDEVVLWFEHDLYDQLHLIQLLSWFGRQDTGKTRISLLCGDQYLGRLRPEQLNKLFPQRHPISSSESQTAQAAWDAFTSSEPSGLVALMQDGMEALPFLQGAFRRHLEQFPGVRDGLSRTERQALQFAHSGLHAFGQMFFADLKLEERIFMGDATYRQYLRRLREAKLPLLQECNDGLELTDLGRAVLAGEKDQIAVNGIDRWLGGVHLRVGLPVWRWDPERGTLSS